MTFLPIVERELRVAARRRFSWVSRLAAATVALMLFLVIQLDEGNSSTLGQIEFAALKWTAFVLALLAGAFLTADSLSEERRQGTLGLLFLTDLRGYDVVLGKLVSHSLLGFYGLLAIFPVLGLAFMAGGVTLSEFWQALLVICNTLFLSLSLGLLASSLSLDSGKALISALCLCLLFSIGLIGMDWLLGVVAYGGDFSAVLSLASPGYLFGSVGSAPFSDFWLSLGWQHAMAWVFLVIASLRTPRLWQEKSGSTTVPRGLFQRWRFGNRKARDAFRRAHLKHDPIAWIVLRDRWLPRVIWVFTFVMILPRILLMFETYYFGSSPGRGYAGVILLSYSMTLIAFFQQLFIAILACRFLGTARANGALELLLVTPISDRQMVRGQLAAMWRVLAFPLITTGAVYLFYIIASMAASRGQSYQYTTPYGICLIAISWAQPFSNAAGLCLFGMWMGLTSRKSSTAVLKTMVFGWLIPMCGIWVATILIQNVLMFALNGGTGWIPVLSLLSTALYLSKDAFLIIWSWKRLTTRFREAAAEVTTPRRGWFGRRWSVISPLPAPVPGHESKA